MNIMIGTAVMAFLAAIFVYLRFSFSTRANARAVQLPVIPEGRRGDARTCPLCAARLENGDTVKSKIFPPSGRSGRLLHILGCKRCLDGERGRLCPLCGTELASEDYLVARIWRLQDETRVQVQGCANCLVGRGRAKATRLR
ncbi:MAG: hypothetical protein LBH50_05240 [Spirochaetaceae bacterium]|nr:hypothetical protein [Spirochaetaceae bacterium]